MITPLPSAGAAGPSAGSMGMPIDLPHAASAPPAAPAPRVDIRETLLALGRLAGRGHIGTETLTSALREIAAPTLRLLAYAVGVKVPPHQSHAELAVRCVPVFRQHFKSTVLRLDTAPDRAAAGPERAPGAWHRLRV